MSSVREEGTPGTEDRHVSGSDCNARHFKPVLNWFIYINYNFVSNFIIGELTIAFDSQRQSLSVFISDRKDVST